MICKWGNTQFGIICSLLLVRFNRKRITRDYAHFLQIFGYLTPFSHIYYWLPSAVVFLNNPAFVNTILRASTHIGRFSLLSVHPLFSKPVVHWRFYAYLFVVQIKSVAMSVQAIKKAKNPRVVPTLENKFENNCWAVIICSESDLPATKKSSLK